MPDRKDPISQLSEANRDTVARLERLQAELAALRGRLSQVESRQDASQGPVLEQGQRLEALQAEIGRLGRIEPALTDLHSNMSHRLDTLRGDLQSGLQAVRTAQASEVERLGREAGLILLRVEALEALPARLESLDRERTALARAVAAAEERAEAALAERHVLQEAQQRSERRVATHVETLQAEIRDLSADLETWRARIEAQDETVREARAVADNMRTEAAKLREDHHAAGETQRMFEGRIEGRLAAAQRQATEDWDRFQRQREADWTLLKQANEARDAQDRALSEQVTGILARLEALEQGLAEGSDAAASNLAGLRHDLALALGAWRQTVGEATELVEEVVGQGETRGAADARRQALRQSLRAQRAGREA